MDTMVKNKIRYNYINRYYPKKILLIIFNVGYDELKILLANK